MPLSARRIATVAALFWAAWLTSISPAAQPQQRLVAIGDIHGSADGLTTILQSAGLIDAQRRWVGGRARLVQTGDFLDRGATVRDVIELLMRLEEEARRAGGRVEVLFGNHEGMNVLHDVRDVSPDAYRSFAGPDAESRRAKGYITHATIARRAGKELNRNDWLRDHPPGFIEYLEAMGPSNRFGRWIRSRKVMTKVDDSLFMHAGLAPASPLTMDDVNRTVEREVRAFDDAVSTLLGADLIAPFFTLQEILGATSAELNRIATLVRGRQDVTQEMTQDYSRLQKLMTIDQWALIAAQGPLWFRGYATLGDDALPQIEGLLKRLGASRFVVGHTPQLPGHIEPRFNNRIFLIDTGMLSSYYKGGRPSALEIASGQITAIYPDERRLLSPVSSR